MYNNRFQKNTLKKILTLLYVCAIGFIGNSSLFAQTSNLVNGIVLNEQTKKPIQFANISVKNSPTGTTTDALGRFKINIVSEKHTVIIVSHISYEKKKS